MGFVKDIISMQKSFWETVSKICHRKIKQK